MRRPILALVLASLGALTAAGGALADAEHAKPPASLQCAGGFELLPLSFFEEEFGVDLSAFDLNENGWLCNRFMPEQSNSPIVGVAIDDIAFANKP